MRIYSLFFVAGLLGLVVGGALGLWFLIMGGIWLGAGWRVQRQPVEPEGEGGGSARFNVLARVDEAAPKKASTINIRLRRERITDDQVGDVTRELSTLLQAGLPLDRALAILTSLADNDDASSILSRACASKCTPLWLSLTCDFTHPAERRCAREGSGTPPMRNRDSERPTYWIRTVIVRPAVE